MFQPIFKRTLWNNRKIQGSHTYIYSSSYVTVLQCKLPVAYCGTTILARYQKLYWRFLKNRSFKQVPEFASLTNDRPTNLCNHDRFTACNGNLNTRLPLRLYVSVYCPYMTTFAGVCSVLATPYHAGRTSAQNFLFHVSNKIA